MEYNQTYGVELPTRRVAVPLGQSRDYEQVESGQAGEAPINEKPPLPPLRQKQHVNSNKTQSKCHLVLVSCAIFAVCLILALLVTVTVLLALEFSATKYQQEFQLLMAEASEMNGIAQTFAKSKLPTLYYS